MLSAIVIINTQKSLNKCFNSVALNQLAKSSKISSCRHPEAISLNVWSPPIRFALLIYYRSVTVSPKNNRPKLKRW